EGLGDGVRAAGRVVEGAAFGTWIRGRGSRLSILMFLLSFPLFGLGCVNSNGAIKGVDLRASSAARRGGGGLKMPAGSEASSITSAIWLTPEATAAPRVRTGPPGSLQSRSRRSSGSLVLCSVLTVSIRTTGIPRPPGNALSFYQESSAL